MNLTVNRAYLVKRLRDARRLGQLGLVFIISTLFLSAAMFSSPESVWLVFLAYPTLLLGFPLRQAGSARKRFWSVAAILPEAIHEEVRPGPKQQLYSYVPLGGEVLDHVLAGPEGLLVIEMRGLMDDPKRPNQITCRRKGDTDVWREKQSFLERFVRLGEPRLGNPSRSLEAKLAALRKWLDERNLSTVPVWGVIIFREGNSLLDISGCEYEVLHLNELRSFLSLGQYFDQDMRAVSLPTDTRNRLNAGMRSLLGLSATPEAAPQVKVERKLSPEARAERERVRAIRAARSGEAAPAGTPEKRPAAKSGPASRTGDRGR